MTDSGSLKICFVCGSLNQHGGSENYAEALARLALRAGFEIAIYTPLKVVEDATIRTYLPARTLRSAQEVWQNTPSGRSIYLAAKARHFLRERRAPTALEEAALGRFRAQAQLKDFWTAHARAIFGGFQIVHLIGKPKTFLVAAARCASRMGKPVVYSEVAQVTEEYAAIADHGEFAGHCHFIDMVLGYYEGQIADIRHRFGYQGEARMVEQWAYDDEDRLLGLSRQSGDTVTFGSLCRLAGEKGLDTLVRAFALAAAQAPHIRLHIAGTGALESDLRNLTAALGLTDRIRFLGYVTDRVAFYQSIDAFVVASRQEGGPITAVEAMAAGCPIITTPVGAMPERLQDGRDGLFFQVDDIDQLSKQFLRLALDAPYRTQLGHAARQRYNQRNQAAINVSAQIDVWESVAAATRTRAC